MKKKIVIVGGGISGMISANYFYKKGFRDIKIFEIKSNLGGVLSDQIFNKDFFFNSCQYFDTKSEWYKYIPSKIRKLDLTEFPHKYSSLTNYEKDSIFNEDFAGPTFNLKPKFKKIRIDGSLESRLNIYPTKVKNFLVNWLNKTKIELSKISSKSSYGLAIRRLYFKNYINLVEKKKKLNVFNETYGQKRNEINLKPLIAAVPLKGFNIFFDNFEKYLRYKDIKIYKKSPIKVKYLNKRIKIFSGKDEIKFDHLLWTGNPTPLIKEVLKKKLDSSHIRSLNFFFKIRKNIKTFHYTQVFCQSSYVNRVFLYHDKNCLKITVEAFEHDYNINSVLDLVLEVFKNLDIKVSKENFLYEGKSISRIYNVISNKDKKNIIKFKSLIKSLKLIDCGWEKYGRDQKFLTIFDSAKRLNS